MKQLWLRAESKPFEKRTPLIPQHAKELIDLGFHVTVEKSNARIFPDHDYKSIGCDLVEAESWRKAPLTAYILGIKEISSHTSPLKHKHIYFAHIYKKQKGSEKIFQAFKNGGGVLYDLEYLIDKKGERIASFGYWSGVSGAGLALLSWYKKHQKEQSNTLFPYYYSKEEDLILKIKDCLGKVLKKPSALIIGAKGRCGNGVASLLNKVGIENTLWDKEETSIGGPFHEILKFDIMFNCVLLSHKSSPFLTMDLVKEKKNLSIIGDVSCEYKGAYNPLPLYKNLTNFEKPCHRVIDGENPLDIIAIDHLPTFLPNESSHSFSKQLIPHLRILFQKGPHDSIWKNSEDLFYQKLKNQ